MRERILIVKDSIPDERVEITAEKFSELVESQEITMKRITKKNYPEYVGSIFSSKLGDLWFAMLDECRVAMITVFADFEDCSGSAIKTFVYEPNLEACIPFRKYPKYVQSNEVYRQLEKVQGVKYPLFRVPSGTEKP